MTSKSRLPAPGVGQVRSKYGAPPARTQLVGSYWSTMNRDGMSGQHSAISEEHGEGLIGTDLNVSKSTSGPTATMPAGSSTNSTSDGVFGWYRYVQDFTGDFALTWLRSLSKGCQTIWEPFAGSGTTLLAAKIIGIPSVGYELNPFMVDVANVKLDWNVSTSEILREAQKIFEKVVDSGDPEPDEVVKAKWDSYEEHLQFEGNGHYPSDKKLEKWISPKVLRRFQHILDEIDLTDGAIHRFLRVAVANLIVSASNMTFRPNICYEARPTIDFPVARAFVDRVNHMVSDFEGLPTTSTAPAEVHLGDARYDGPSTADVIFTSPPYPNDMEYIHQTRLELALLRYTHGQSDLTSLKKKMISSSVKLVYRENQWQKERGIEVDSVSAVCAEIAETLVGKNWGWNASDMTAQFFGGMRSVLQNWHDRLAPHSVAAVVIGDSAFNGVKVPTDVLLADVAAHHGFKCEDIEVFRTRWNTRHDIELRESVVVLRRV